MAPCTAQTLQDIARPGVELTHSGGKSQSHECETPTYVYWANSIPNISRTAYASPAKGGRLVNCLLLLRFGPNKAGAIRSRGISEERERERARGMERRKKAMSAVPSRSTSSSCPASQSEWGRQVKKVRGCILPKSCKVLLPSPKQSSKPRASISPALFS